MTVPIIHSDRLELISMSPAFLDAILAGRRADAEEIAKLKLPRGWPDERDSRLLHLRRDQMRRGPDSQQWLIRAMVLPAEGRPMIGHIGFHGAPETMGRAEIGYSVQPDQRRRGYAAEAARGLMDWAAREHGITGFL